MRAWKWLGMSFFFAAVVLSGGLQPAWLATAFVDVGGVVILTYPFWPLFRRDGRASRER